MTIDELLEQVDRRFKNGMSADAVLTDHLAEFTTGMLEAERADANPAPTSTWVKFGWLTRRYQVAEAAKDPGLRVVGKLGPVREQD